ncbi:MAG TPA: hypothetical protein VK165_20325 [Azonexus sp.]|nr:hypothetical protein [Azonexus sp.]
MRWILVAIAAFLSGCSIYPIAPNQGMKVTDPAVTNQGYDDSTVTLSVAKKVVTGWLKVYEDAMDDRRYWELGFSEGFFYGSVFAVLGQVKHWVGLRNTGAATAAGSLLLQDHYKLAQQRAAFNQAIGRLSCMRDALLEISPVDENAFTLAKDRRLTLALLPAKVVRTVDTVRRDLKASLDTMTLTTPTRDDIASSFKNYLVAKDKPVPLGEAAVSAAEKDLHEEIFAATIEADKDKSSDMSKPNSHKALTVKELESRKLAFIKAIDTVDANFDLCMKVPAAK